MTVLTDVPTIELLKNRFAKFDTRFNPDRRLHVPDSVPVRPASVLIPLFYKDSELHVLLTVRHKNMPSHGGQVAFPGGMKADEDRDQVATALRETYEEVGIKPEEVEVIAVLPPNIVRPNSLVTPVVGIVKDGFVLDLDPKEVDMVFDLPLKRFLSEEGRFEKVFKFENGLDFKLYHFKDKVNGQEVETWGFTAIQCIQVAMVTFQSDFTISLYNDVQISKENCFDITATKAIVEKWNIKANL